MAHLMPPVQNLKKRQNLLAQESKYKIDYSKYLFNQNEIIRYVLIAIGEIVFAAYICYDSILLSVILVPYIPYYLHSKKSTLTDERKWRLNLQFGDGIGCISSALESGYAVENAILEAYEDLKLNYVETELIMIEFRNIIQGIRNNMTIEEAFTDLGVRSDVEDIRSFADIFSTTKRTGGNIIEVIRATSELIHTRVEMKREIRTIVASKKFEADIMKIVPIAMLAYLKVFSFEMVSALYGNLSGMVIMTILLAVYIGLCKVSDYIVRIEL